jgi:hypothetical protein
VSLVNRGSLSRLTEAHVPGPPLQDGQEDPFTSSQPASLVGYIVGYLRFPASPSRASNG